LLPQYHLDIILAIGPKKQLVTASQVLRGCSSQMKTDLSGLDLQGDTCHELLFSPVA
jgi:hypothetical protein